MKFWIWHCRHLTPLLLAGNALGVNPATSKSTIGHQRRPGLSIDAAVTFKEPNICETTPGIKSYSGYVNLDGGRQAFFWYFEARMNPKDAQTTLWLNGGPGSDSLMGLFGEMGPCTVTPDLNTTLNPFSWSEATNLLFLSQPVGVGFSYVPHDEAYLKFDDGEHGIALPS
jgi:carboxypeptidase C (cathepsin A)